MTLGPHLDVHPDDFPKQHPMVGQIKAVLPKDHPENPTGTFTVYNVEAYEGFSSGPRGFENVPVLGQMAAGDIEIEITYSVGQYVMMGFRNGDPNLPFIMGAFPWHDTDIAHSTGEGPRIRVKANGALITVTKDGDISLAPASGRTLYLGGETADATMKRLVHEEFISALASLFTSATVSFGDGGTALKTYMAANLNASLITANTTDSTKGT
jgi:hypothetical protein